MMIIMLNNICTFLGRVDNSGLRFSLTQTPREFNAGVTGIGSIINSNLFIPPNAGIFDVFGYCPSTCTREVSRHNILIGIIFTK